MGGRKEQTGHMLMHSMFHDSVLSNVLEDRFLFSQKTPCSHIYAINLTNIKEQRHLGNNQSALSMFYFRQGHRGAVWSAQAFDSWDIVLADKGFLIQDILPCDVSVSISLFLNMEFSQRVRQRLPRPLPNVRFMWRKPMVS